MPQPSGKVSRKWRRQIASIRRPRTPSQVPVPLRPESQARRTKEPLRSLPEPSLRGSRPPSVREGISPPRSLGPPRRLQNLHCATLHLHCYREMPLSYLPLLGLGAIMGLRFHHLLYARIEHMDSRQIFSRLHRFSNGFLSYTIF